MLPMSASASTATTSAPSSANRIACARPWPRAAPVMNATLPSSLPMRASLVRRRPGNWTRRQVTGRPGSPIGPVLAGQVPVLVEREQGQPGPSGGERRDRAVDGDPVEGDEAGRAGAEQVGADGRDHAGGGEDDRILAGVEAGDEFAEGVADRAGEGRPAARVTVLDPGGQRRVEDDLELPRGARLGRPLRRG